MDTIDALVKKHYTSLLPIFDNILYNKQQSIEDYFDKEIMVIYSGHGGSGWNKRTLAGVYKDDDRYLLLKRKDPYSGYTTSSLLERERWYLFIVLPENIEKLRKLYDQNRPTIRPDSIGL